ncbi:MAG: S-layer protein [Candidatus Micrarchaeota archaeon]|nr:S-layer protein [Candidatus Micrarchaeota archaeon]
MKSLSVRKIASVVAGAAIIGSGLAFSSVTFQNVPVISTSGQPVVQVVVGSNAKASDGVAAANIAAAIGNLAFTSVPVTASVNATQASKVLKVAVSNPSYTLSNQQVWLNESGSVGSTAGTYAFTTLIGSVLNGGITLGSVSSTKGIQGNGQYANPENTGISLSPAASPYTAVGFVPVTTTVTATSNGGGVSYTTFTSGKSDNLLQITPTQFSSLASNWGAVGETENLWLTGFPVYNQNLVSGQPTGFQVFDAGGAYQATFAKPIQFNANASGASGSSHFQKSLGAQIKLLGQNWTVIGGYGGATVGSANTVAGGKLQLAASSTAVTTVYVGHNLTTGNFTVQLQDLGQATSAGVSPAALAIYYQGKLTNTSTVYPGNTVKFNVSNKNVFVKVNNTFAGYYQYAKYAKLQAYTNVFNVTNGQAFNVTTNPGWIAEILWTNTTSSSAANAQALQSIVLYNATPTNLSPGQSFYFVQNPQAFKVTFLGDTLSAANFDPVTVTTTTSGSLQYTNAGSAVSAAKLSITNITEPGQLLTATSQIPNAFTYSGQTSGSVQFLLTPYKLNEFGNTLVSTDNSLGGGGPLVSFNSVNVIYNGGNANVVSGNWITSTNPLTVTLTGYTSNTASSATSASVTFTANTANAILGTNFFNITSIRLSRALPGTITVNVFGGPNAAIAGGNVLLLASLVNSNPGVLYTQSGQVFQTLALQGATVNAVYNQQNGNPTTSFSLSPNSVITPTAASPGAGSVGQYFQFSVNEISVPTNTNAQDQLTIGIFNSTGGVGASPLFNLNYSITGTHANVTYMSTNGVSLNAVQGFRTERGTKVATIGATSDTFNIAKSVDTLQIAVGTAGSATPTTTRKLYGPYAVGATTNIANVSIGKVNATIALGAGSTYTISGINNITATPSVTTATTPVLLKNITKTPLVVLDSQANAGSNLILVGSGYVNTLSQQLQSAYNVSASPTMQVDQAYGTNRILVAGYTANQTTAAANAFIQQLYAATH